MHMKVNCFWNEDSKYCKHPAVKRSFFGIGAKNCKLYHGESCMFQDPEKKKGAPPPPPVSTLKERERRALLISKNRRK